MTNAAAETSILLVDDGELDAVAALLDAQGRRFERLCGAEIPEEIPPPKDLLVVTPGRADRVRRGSPRNAAPGYPLRIIAVDEDSPAMRRRLRSAGAQLLVRLPADDEIWRLLVTRALYRGHERRRDPRVTVGSPVRVADARPVDAAEMPPTTLVDLSNRGCRLHTTESFSVGQMLAFTIPPAAEGWDGDDAGLTLRGRVRRIVHESDAGGQTIAMTFDEDLPQSVRTGLTRLINRWASGPLSIAGPAERGAPKIPSCRLPSLPDLMLDDETDPPVRSRSAVLIEVDRDASENPIENSESDRRSGVRGHFESTVVAESCDGPVVLIGRDLAPGGMRVEAVSALRMADRFRLALHGPGPTEPLVVHAEVVRDDGDDGFALAFRGIDDLTKRKIEKLVACLPDVESLESNEMGGMGAILSELIPD